MIINILMMAVGWALLTGGAELLVRGCSSLALRLGVTPLLVGLTVVAFGTSSPELFVSLKASFAGQGDLALGNVVGSNSFNIGVILGLTAIICPLTVKLQILRIDAPVMLGSVILMAVLVAYGEVGRLAGLILLILLVAYTSLNFWLAKRENSREVAEEFEEGVPPKSSSFGVDIFLIIGGFVLLFLGARFLVDYAVLIARFLGVSEAVIGLTIVAAGTSLPELATSVVAAIRKEPDIALGNVVGSNTFNALGILGTTAFVQPLSARNIHWVDLAVMVGLSVMLIPLFWSGLKLQRVEGGVLLGCYCFYLAYLWPK